MIALLPSLGVTALAGLLAAGRVAEAGDARDIDRAMVSIQRLDELHAAVDAGGHVAPPSASPCRRSG